LIVVSTEGVELKDEGMREFVGKVEPIDDGGGLVFPSSYSFCKSHVFELIWRLLIWMGLLQFD